MKPCYRHSIANHVRYKIASLLTEKVSLSFIAKSCQVSLTTVIRTLKEFKSYLPKQSKKILPRVLMVDEFRSHASIEDKMSFICADGETGKLIDVLPTRKLPDSQNQFIAKGYLGKQNKGIGWVLSQQNIPFDQSFLKNFL
ncbi:hypothetical protein EfmJHP35_18790 [Enterococcus faecium]|nr:hypothetical protein EfmJHP35_18790 [Enterococcus faecium]